MIARAFMGFVLGASACTQAAGSGLHGAMSCLPPRSLAVVSEYFREHPGALMRAARSLARSRPVQESLVFTLTGARGEERQEGLLRLDPRSPDGVVLRLDLGDLSVSVREIDGSSGEPRTELVGVRGFDPGRYVKQEAAGEATLAVFQKLVPPVPVPVLALALGDDRDWDQLLPLGEPVEWIAAAPEGAMWRVLGVSTGGGAVATPISVWLDGGTLAVRRVESAWDSPRGELRVRVDAAPIPAMPTKDWVVDISGRVEVGRWTDLRAPPARIVEDGVFPGSLLNERDGRAWSAFEVQQGEPPERRYTLVVLYLPGDGVTGAAGLVQAGVRARSALEGDFARRLSAGEVPAPVRLRVRPAPCFSSEAFTAEALADETGRWRGEAGADPILFSLAPDATLHAAAPGANVVGVLVGADMRVLGVYAPAGDRDGVIDAIASRIRRNAWPGWSP